MTKKFMTLSILMTGMLVAWPVAAGNPPSASGHGEIAFVIPGPGTTRSVQYSFVAHQLKSGVKGQAEILFDGFTRFHVDVDCLTITQLGPPSIPPIATVGGIVTNVQTAGAPPFIAEGARVFFTMRDRGEGSNDPPDQLGLPAFLPPGSPFVCPEQVTFPLLNTEGNVQVRP